MVIVEDLLCSIIKHWRSICDEAELAPVERNSLWGRQFLNPYAFEDLDGDTAYLKTLAEDARSR